MEIRTQHYIVIKELSLVGKYPVGPIQKWMDKSGNGNHAIASRGKNHYQAQGPSIIRTHWN